LAWTGALDLKTGKSVQANPGNEMFPPLSGDPWSGRKDEIVFTLPVPGKDGPGVPFFINMNSSMEMSPHRRCISPSRVPATASICAMPRH
jgi:hypothetical protein